MPHILPAAAAAISAAAPAVAATAAKAALVTTLKTVALKALTQVAISAAMSALQPQVGFGGRTFDLVLDPDGPIPFGAGRVGVPGSVVHKDTFGPDLMYYAWPTVLSGGGPIQGIESVKADDEFVTFDGAGKAITSQYANELWFVSRPGDQPDTALPSPTGLKSSATLPGWTSAHKLSGFAAYMLVMGENSKGTAYPKGEVKPIITFEGLKVYDPRLDSTYPGGSGSHRLSNPATWTYSENPILWALKWALGIWAGPTGKGAPQVDYQVGGIGAKPAGIDFPAFVAAANVADANDWTVSAYPNTDDDKHQVMTAFLQAGGAIYAQRAGKISCIQRAAPRTSVVTLSAADTAGPLEIDTAASRIDRINTIRPRYWSEAHRWQMTAMSEVSPAAYVVEDGAKRTRGIDYPFVNNARQAGQLAALQIANTREGIAGVIPLKPHLQRIRPGDAFTITEAGFVLNGLKCLCLNTDYDPANGIVRVTFVSETDGKYPFALGLDPDPPEPQVLTPVDPTYVSPPLPEDWTITPRPPVTGGQLPGFDLTGVVDNATATAVLVEHGPDDEGPWTQAYQGPPTVTTIPIDGLQPNEVYYVAVSYQRGSNWSARQVYGPYTAPALVAGDVAPGSPVWAAVDDLINGVDGVAADLAAAVLDLEEALADADAGLSAAIDAVDADLALLAGDVEGVSLIVDSHTTELAGKAEQTDLEAAIVRLTARGNRVPNSTGALGMAGLTTFGPHTVQAFPDASGGPQFGAFAGDVVLEQFGASWEPQPATAGFKYSIQAELAAFDLISGSVRAYAAYRDATDTILPDGYQVVAAYGGDFERVENEGFEAPAGTVSVVVSIDVDGASFGPGGSPQWRRIKLEEGEVCTPWTDDATDVAISADLIEQRALIADLEEGKASVTSLDLERARIDDAEALNADQTAALVDLELNKAEATDLETTQAEIDAARDGEVSLLAKVTALRTAQIADDEVLASSIEAVEGRTDTAEADILALDLAQITESEVRAAAIEQVEVRLTPRRNLLVNPSAAMGMEGLTNFGPRTVVAYPTAPSGPQWSASASSTGPEDFGTRWEVFGAKENTPYSLQADLGGYGMTGGQVRSVGLFQNDVGSTLGAIVAIHYGGDFTLIKTENVVSPAGTTRIAFQIDTYQTSFGPSGSVAWRQIKLEEGPICTPFSDDASTIEISAGVSALRQGVIDLEAEKASAIDLVLTQAELDGLSATVSDVSEVAVSADGIARATKGVLLDVGGYVSGTVSENDGETAFFGVLADVFSVVDPDGTAGFAFEDGRFAVPDDVVDARTVYGRVFGGSDRLIWWTGPSSVPEGDETKANAYIFISGTAPIIGGPGFPVTTFSPTATRGNVKTTSSTGTVASTTPLVITPTGATGTVDYTWDRIGGDSRISVNSPTAASTLFTITGLGSGETVTARFAWSAYDAGTGKVATGVAIQTFTHTA